MRIKTLGSYTVLFAALVGAAVSLGGCENQSSVVNANLKEDADNFRIDRHIYVINTRTKEPIYELEGYCNVDKGDTLPNELIFICKTDDGQFDKNFAFLNDNVTVAIRQLHPTKESTVHYKYMFNPGTIIPMVEVNESK